MGKGVLPTSTKGRDNIKIVELEIGNKVIGIRLPKEFKGGGIEKFIKGQDVVTK